MSKLINLFSFSVTAAVAIWLWEMQRKEPEKPRSIHFEPVECITACVNHKNQNSVFPELDKIVKDCEARYLRGCELTEKE